MEKEAYRQHFELEETFWWFLGRREAVRCFLGQVPVPSILDVGCGTGGMLQFFEAFGRSVGLDLSAEALAYCKRRQLTGRLIQGSALHLPFSDERFDLVTACDLLYHQNITDDLAALHEFHRVCRKGGHLLVTDSAFPCLRGPHDHFFHGERRYTVKGFKSKLEESGFCVERISYLNVTLFPFLYLWRKACRSTPRSDLRPLPLFLNRWLRTLVFSEARVLRRWNFPFGTSVIALARKPEVIRESYTQRRGDRPADH